MKRLHIGKYKNKKTVKDQDGKDMIVYEYSDRQVNKRHKEKSEKVEKIRKNIGDLESQVLKDLKKEDTRQVALAVALINHTYERVGNDESASNGHYGVTGWKKKHLSFKGGKAVLSYTGKSGVRHTKEVDDKALVSALRDISKGKEGDDELLGDIKAPDVNKYLDQFGITAKDIRGYHANREMQERLKALRQENGELPKDKKEKEQILKDEFKEALKGAAKAVGHEEATLRGQYLVPHLEETYMKDGTVITTLKKARINRIATRIFGTKSDAEKSDEEAERLVSPSPKKKPPRTDKDRRRVKTEDKDIDEDPDLKSKDTSMNYKVIGGSMGGVITRVASRYLMASRIATRYMMRQRVASRWLQSNTEIVETPKEQEAKKSQKEKDKDEKEKEEKKKSLVQRKEKEAWAKFTETERMKDPETKREVSWSTFEKKNPKEAQKIRREFRTKFEEDFTKSEEKAKAEQKDSLKTLTDEQMEGFDSMREEVVNMAGKEIRLPYDTTDKVRSVVFALEDGQKDDETVEEYNQRKKKEVLDLVKNMDTKDLQQMWDAGIIDQDDPRVNEAIDTIMSLPAMNDVVGRPMTEVEADMLKDYYLGITQTAVDMTFFGTKETDKTDFLADFITGAKERAVEALKNDTDPDLGAIMKEHMASMYGKSERNDIKVRNLVTMTKDQKKAIKDMEEAKKKVDALREKAQKGMDRVKAIDDELSAEGLDEAKKEELEKEKSELSESIKTDKDELSSSMDELNKITEKTKPTQEQLQKALDKMVSKLPEKEKKKIQKELKEFGNDDRVVKKILELSKAEATEKYIELIENSKMSPEEKKKAIERTKSPNFDPDGALAGMMSQSDEGDGEI